MCSRYSFVPDARAFADVGEVLGEIVRELLALTCKDKFLPTDPVPIVIQRRGEAPQVVTARWGLIPHWWKKPELPRSTFNARSEEAPGKPSWRDAWKQSRCLIPATSWYEWQKAQGVKIPHTLSPADRHGFMFAGLWSVWRPRPEAEWITTCAMLTTEAAPGIAHVHDRMPVVLAPEAWTRWLDPEQRDPDAVARLLREHTVSGIRAVTVGSH